MKTLFIEYPKCSTCQKAKKWLENNNIQFDDRNIVEQTPTIEELSNWIKESKKETKKWFNTSGLKYKELNLKDNLKNMSDEEMIEKYDYRRKNKLIITKCNANKKTNTYIR